jgi:hypothetical protein
MSDRARLAKAAPSIILATTLLLVGCWRRNREAPVQPAATPTREILPAAPATAPGSAIPVTPSITAEPMEPYVDLELVDAPVRLVLQRLAEIGGLQLVIPPNLNRTISVQYVRVPVSVALDDVLKRSGLRLGSGPSANLPFDTVTVFYQLPANIDSLSVDAIMKRFGVSRTMAELIVRSRRP